MRLDKMTDRPWKQGIHSRDRCGNDRLQAHIAKIMKTREKKKKVGVNKQRK
jgi:hypothetical protein